MNKQELAAMVAEILNTMEQPPMVKAGSTGQPRLSRRPGKPTITTGISFLM